MGKELKITIYTTPNCVQCDTTKRLFTKAGIEYNLIDLSNDPEAMEMVKGLGHTASPVVIAGERHWSGFRINKIQKTIDEIRKPKVDYKQQVRDLIYQGRETNKPIYEIADEVEKIIRGQIEQERRTA
jgi:glutaredoxin-like protein NrdH